MCEFSKYWILDVRFGFIQGTRLEFPVLDGTVVSMS